MLTHVQCSDFGVGFISRSQEPLEMMTCSEQKWGKAPRTLTQDPLKTHPRLGTPTPPKQKLTVTHIPKRWLCLLLGIPAGFPPPALTVCDSLPTMRQRGLLQTSALVFFRGPRPLTLIDSCTGVAVSRKRTAWPRSLRGRICFA